VIRALRVGLTGLVSAAVIAGFYYSTAIGDFVTRGTWVGTLGLVAFVGVFLTVIWLLERRFRRRARGHVDGRP
jgi:hypothetical protein